MWPRDRETSNQLENIKLRLSEVDNQVVADVEGLQFSEGPHGLGDEGQQVSGVFSGVFYSRFAVLSAPAEGAVLQPILFFYRLF